MLEPTAPGRVTAETDYEFGDYEQRRANTELTRAARHNWLHRDGNRVGEGWLCLHSPPVQTCAKLAVFIVHTNPTSLRAFLPEQTVSLMNNANSVATFG